MTHTSAKAVNNQVFSARLLIENPESSSAVLPLGRRSPSSSISARCRGWRCRIQTRPGDHDSTDSTEYKVFHSHCLLQASTLRVVFFFCRVWLCHTLSKAGAMADSSLCRAGKQQHRLPCSLKNVGRLSSLQSYQGSAASPSPPSAARSHFSSFPPLVCAEDCGGS